MLALVVSANIFWAAQQHERHFLQSTLNPYMFGGSRAEAKGIRGEYQGLLLDTAFDQDIPTIMLFTKQNVIRI
jgi:hypothetical protein